MQICQEAMNLIKHFEGFSSKAYVCPAGHLTIGYGHLVRQNENFTQISNKEAEYLLECDISNSCNAVNRLIYHPLNEFQFGAIVSFTYNLGSGNLQSSTLRSKLNQGLIFEAAHQFSRFVYCSGVKLRGLKLRREAEMELFLRK